MPYLNSDSSTITGNGEVDIENASQLRERVINNCSIVLEVTGTAQGTATILVKPVNCQQFINPTPSNTMDLASKNRIMVVLSPIEQIRVTVTGADPSTVTKVIGNWYE